MPENIPYWRLSGFYFSHFAFLGAFTPYWSLYLKSLDFSAFQIGVLMSVMQGMRIFAPNLWGWQADRTGNKLRVVRITVFFSLIAYLGVFFGKAFWWLFATMMLMSFFWSASLPLIEATTLNHLGASTEKYGRIRSWGSVGFIVAVIGLGYILDLLPIQSLLWATLGFMIGMFFFSQKIPEASSPPHESDSISVWEILGKSEVVSLFASCLLMAAAHGPYYTFYSIYLVDHGYMKSSIGWLWGLGVICEIAVFFLMPRIMARFSMKAILAFSLACAVLRFILIGWGVDVLFLLVLAQVLHAATFGSHHAAAMAAIHHFFRGRHQAKGQSFYTSLVYGAGGTLGAMGGGYAWGACGPQVTFGLSAAAALIGLVWLLTKFRLSPC
ncbi:MAG: MFS transporter [Burkholderiales bacterium]|nr:MFS transporter [Burkholderiales bacterium]